MMREIKFRAWDADEGRMWYSHENGNAFLDNRNEEHTFYFNFNPKTGNMEAVAESFPYLVASDPFDVYDTEKHYLTIMQYTGTKDKNGKEIYESDIIQIKDRFVMWSRSKGQITEDVNAVVEWSGRGFTPRRLRNTRTWILDMEQYEVIGNIYENPKLIRDVKNEV